MLRKLLTVSLVALGIGLGAAAHPAQGASYAGGSSYQLCPVPQECCGHIEYQLQRQTVLQNVQETVYETQYVPSERTVCETVMQPRTINTVPPPDFFASQYGSSPLTAAANVTAGSRYHIDVWDSGAGNTFALTTALEQK